MTVALPMRNSKDISFLAFESLLNQKAVHFDWELIVYEEEHENMTPRNIIRQYEKRFKNTRCVRFKYITGDGEPLLIDKWIEIANNASDTSVSYLLQAADCYSYSLRLANTYEVINNCDFSWYDNYRGYFYSFLNKKIIEYTTKMSTNLSMALRTDVMRRIKTKEIHKGIDNYIYNQSKLLTKGLFFEYRDDELYTDGIDTHGYNNISTKRQSFFDDVRMPFSETEKTLKDLNSPKEIKERINDL